MGDQPRQIQSRYRRLRVYLAHNRDRIVVDALVMAAWTVVTWTVFGAVGLPAWLFYLVLFIGVIVYSRLTPPWERPYRSPDLDSSQELEEGEYDRDQP